MIRRTQTSGTTWTDEKQSHPVDVRADRNQSGRLQHRPSNRPAADALGKTTPGPPARPGRLIFGALIFGALIFGATSHPAGANRDLLCRAVDTYVGTEGSVAPTAGIPPGAAQPNRGMPD